MKIEFGNAKVFLVRSAYWLMTFQKGILKKVFGLAFEMRNVKKSIDCVFLSVSLNLL